MYYTFQGCQYTMRIINADGTEAEMCGNGIRCLALFIHELEDNLSPSSTSSSYSISTLAGKIITEVNERQL
jgi:diaminopimelate epimerase